MAGIAGFVVVGLGLAVAREVKIAFQLRPAAEVIGSAVSAVGSLRWVDTTLVGGMIAVAAAGLSFFAVMRQILASDAGVKRQMAHAATLESARIDAKHAAARAVLPLALSALSEYAQETSQALLATYGLLSNHALPKTAVLPKFPSFPEYVVTSIKEMIEFSSAEDRHFMWQMLVRVQVQRTRISELVKSHARASSIVMTSNIEAYLLDAAEIYGRSSALYKFARGVKNAPPRIITRQHLAEALTQIGIYDDLHEEMVQRYKLTGVDAWGEQWLA